MIKYFLASVAALGLMASGTAFAADMPIQNYEPMAPIATPIFTWTGFYVGANAGYAWNSNDDDKYFGSTYYSGGNNDDGGFTGGAQAGYNLQFGQFVVGVEADINYADLKGKDNTLAWEPSSGSLGGSQSSVEWYGTVRGRLGFAIDQALIYATGGLAYGGGGNDRSFVYNDAIFKAKNDIRMGWVAGAGIEYAFTDNISARIEGLYVNLGKEEANYFAPVQLNRKDTEFGVVRAGLNYKFGSF
ncbi:outer membrane protein [Pseudochelatococcus contaminans]|uniref:Outer membrane immunogenic protein n=1 Tax=Pseudochelatococcus contaminans TaxID=1538103 RepID=A0A7W5Z5E2_9HYPH|nr:outer membrane protein [Pseudochelatococcus contaminans]MBB3810503.1 outer membrane immunogenic protein [Pseudochelatococcus contaminans]